jgi:hypothetical protein
MLVATPGHIEGTIRDLIGSPVPGVSVTALPERGGQVIRATTDVDGTYRLNGLAEDTYRVDCALLGFEGTRQNHVRVRADGRTQVDAVLRIRPVCECVNLSPLPISETVVGEIVDDAGRPLPHAHLEIASPARRESATAGGNGRFVIHPPAEGVWQMTASDTGFAPVSRQISNATREPLVLTLRFVGTQGLPDTEMFNHGCSCPEYFAHEER